MSRPLRIQFSGAWYHVMNRGACRKPIFKEDEHRKLFLELLNEIVELLKIELHAYCLMDNHFHLMIRTPDANLSKAMQHLSSVYTIRYNKLEKSDGPLFRGRFKAKLVESDRYGIDLVRYIHRNPLEAGIVRELERYSWSSFPAYLGLVQKPDWLCDNYVREQFSTMDFRKEFYNHTLDGGEEIGGKFFSVKNDGSIIGTDDFIEKIKTECPYSSVSEEILERKILRPDLHLILKEVSILFNIDSVNIIKRRRGVVNVPKSIFMLIARKYFSYKLNEISNFLGLKSYQAIHNTIRIYLKKIEEDPILKSSVEKILKNLQVNVYIME